MFPVASVSDTFSAQGSYSGPNAEHEVGLDGRKWSYPYSAATNGYNRVGSTGPFVRVAAGVLEIDCCQSCGNVITSEQAVDLRDKSWYVLVTSWPEASDDQKARYPGSAGSSPFGNILIRQRSMDFGGAGVGLRRCGGTNPRWEITGNGEGLLARSTVLPGAKHARIRHASGSGNGTMHFEASLDGVTWRTLHSAPAPISMAAVIVHHFTENGDGDFGGFGTKMGVPWRIDSINAFDTSAIPEVPPVTTQPTDSTQPIWRDEFDSLSLSTDTQPGRWRTRGVDDGGSLSVGYRDYAGPGAWNVSPIQHPGHNPFSVADSVLTIKAKRTPSGVTNVGGAPWMSGYLVSDPNSGHSFKEGYFEIRARFPNPCRGMFPALWLFSNREFQSSSSKRAAEIDIFEVFGNPNGQPWASALHLKPSPGTTVGVGSRNEETAQWHRYGLERTPDALRFYRDGVLVHTVTGSNATFFAGEPMGIRLNYAMDPGWETTANKSTPSDPPMGFEPRMEVDYVRVFAAKPANLATGSADPLSGSSPTPPPPVVPAPVPAPTEQVKIGTASYPLAGSNTARGSDELVLYTDSNGTSPANQWGAEAVVTNGKIASLSDRQTNGASGTTIPKGSVLLSGHGAARDWLLANGKVGATVNAPGITVQTPVQKLGLPELNRGSTDRESVKTLQGLLVARGFAPANTIRADGTVDGGFGSGTQTAVSKFQEAVGLLGSTSTVKGVVGEPTWRKLLRL